MSHNFKVSDRVIYIDPSSIMYLKRGTVLGLYSDDTSVVDVKFDQLIDGWHRWDVKVKRLILENDPSIRALIHKVEDQKRRQAYAMRYL